MRAQAFAMIGGNHDQRIVVQLAGSQRRDQFPNRCVSRSYRSIVGSLRRGAGIIQMHPQEEWAAGIVG